MGSIISRIADDYEDYVWFCAKLDITPLGDRDEKSFYKHEKEILAMHDVDTKEELFKKLEC